MVPGSSRQFPANELLIHRNVIVYGSIDLSLEALGVRRESAAQRTVVISRVLERCSSPTRSSVDGLSRLSIMMDAMRGPIIIDACTPLYLGEQRDMRIILVNFRRYVATLLSAIHWIALA